jgi:hypothetical protein
VKRKERKRAPAAVILDTFRFVSSCLHIRRDKTRGKRTIHGYAGGAMSNAPVV